MDSERADVSVAFDGDVVLGQRGVEWVDNDTAKGPVNLWRDSSVHEEVCDFAFESDRLDGP